MTITTMLNRVKILKQKFTQSLGLPFRNLLPESTIQSALEAEKIKYRQRLFDPGQTHLIFEMLIGKGFQTFSICAYGFMEPLLGKASRI